MKLPILKSSLFLFVYMRHKLPIARWVSGLLLSSVIFLAFPLSGFTESSSYVDESGNIHFVDSIRDVPDRYKNQVVKVVVTPLNDKEYKKSIKDFKTQQAHAQKEQKRLEKEREKLEKKRQHDIRLNDKRTGKDKLPKKTPTPDNSIVAPLIAATPNSGTRFGTVTR